MILVYTRWEKKLTKDTLSHPSPSATETSNAYTGLWFVIIISQVNLLYAVTKHCKIISFLHVFDIAPFFMFSNVLFK